MAILNRKKTMFSHLFDRINLKLFVKLGRFVGNSTILEKHWMWARNVITAMVQQAFCNIHQSQIK